MNITFYADNVDPRIPEMQKKVFETLGMTIHQIKPTKWEGHGGVIDGWLRGNIDALDENEIIILWDIDCIPLNAQIIEEAIKDAGQYKLVGIAQKASHIPNSIIYAGPAFLAFSIKTYKALGCPTFACTNRSDCAAELTYVAREKGVEVRLLYPSHVEKPMWQLDGPVMFGKGTTFGNNDIYHAFYSRKGNEQMFLKKCEDVIKRHEQAM